MDPLSRIVLFTGIAISGAALIAWIIRSLPSAPAPITPADRGNSERRSEEGRPPTPPAPVGPASTEDKTAAFFAALPPRPATAPPGLEQFAGTWRATIVSVDVEGGQAPIREPRALSPFTFVIKPAGGGWQMAAADGRGSPRTLAAAAGEVVARGEGAPDIRLNLQGNRLIGFIATERPARGRIEFHATKEP